MRSTMDKSKDEVVAKKTPAAAWKKGIVACLMLVSVFVILFVPWHQESDFSLVNNTSMHYVRARVLSVDAESLQSDDLEPGRVAGTQEITVQILNGSLKGQTVTLTNYVTRSVNVVCKEGLRIILCVDTPENAEAYYTVYNYDRGGGLLLILGLFIGIVLVVGGKRGGFSLLGLAYTVFVIFAFLIQAVYYGWSPALAGFLTVLLTGAASVYLIGGPTRKTVAAFLATTAGVLCAAVIYAVCAAALHLSGYNLDTAESLILIQNQTGLHVSGLIFCAVIVAALGAVMDVAVSVSSSLQEIHQLNPDRSAKELMHSGMNIGKDMIGTMTNTLILAFVGSALTTVILLKGYGYDMALLLNSDYVAIEVTEGIAATLGVILTVPLASAISAWLFTMETKESKQ